MPFGFSRLASSLRRFSASGLTPCHWKGVWALGTKVLTPRVNRSPGVAFLRLSSRAAVLSTSSSVSQGSPTIP